MKKAIIISLFILTTTISNAQETITIPEPEYSGRILYVENANKGVSLEQQKASVKGNFDAASYLIGIGKHKFDNKIRGLNSPIRIKKAEKYQFIIRVKDNTYDPLNQINIFKLNQKVKKNKNKSFRYVEVSSHTTFVGSKSMDIKYYQFDVIKYGKGSFLITLLESLDSGEYAITLSESRDLFNMFGID